MDSDRLQGGDEVAVERLRGDVLRARFQELQASEPLALALLAGLYVGPENVPAEALDGHLVAALQTV